MNTILVSAHRKIDVLKLKELVSTISLEEFSKKCATGVDGFFLARKRSIRESHQLDRLRTLQKISDVPMFKTLDRIKDGDNPLIAPAYFNDSFADPRSVQKFLLGVNKTRFFFKFQVLIYFC